MVGVESLRRRPAEDQSIESTEHFDPGIHLVGEVEGGGLERVRDIDARQPSLTKLGDDRRQARQFLRIVLEQVVGEVDADPVGGRDVEPGRQRSADLRAHEPKPESLDQVRLSGCSIAQSRLGFEVPTVTS